MTTHGSINVRALWDYEAQEDNEISFLAGDVFAVVEMQNDDWWEGVIGEQRGYFPANRVEVVVERRAVTGSSSNLNTPKTMRKGKSMMEGEARSRTPETSSPLRDDTLDDFDSIRKSPSEAVNSPMQKLKRGLNSSITLGSLPNLAPGRSPIISSENRSGNSAANVTVSKPHEMPARAVSNPSLNSGSSASPVVKRVQREGISPSMQERMSIWAPAAESVPAPSPNIMRPKPKISELKISVKERMNMLLDAAVEKPPVVVEKSTESITGKDDNMMVDVPPAAPLARVVSNDGELKASLSNREENPGAIITPSGVKKVGQRVIPIGGVSVLPFVKPVNAGGSPHISPDNTRADSLEDISSFSAPKNSSILRKVSADYRAPVTKSNREALVAIQPLRQNPPKQAQESEPFILPQDNIRRDGYLGTQNGNATLVAYWAELGMGKLAFFESEYRQGGNQPIMTELIDLLQTSLQVFRDENSGQEYFVISTPTQNFIFQAQDEIDCIGWITAIQDEIGISSNFATECVPVPMAVEGQEIEAMETNDSAAIDTTASLSHLKNQLYSSEQNPPSANHQPPVTNHQLQQNNMAMRRSQEQLKMHYAANIAPKNNSNVAYNNSSAFSPPPDAGFNRQLEQYSLNQALNSSQEFLPMVPPPEQQDMSKNQKKGGVMDRFKNDSRNGSKNDLMAPGTPKPGIKDKLLGFFKKRPNVEQLQQRGILRDDDVFGGILERICMRENSPIPNLVFKCITEIETRGLESLGLYRLSGNVSAIQKLKFDFQDDSARVNLSEVRDINIITGVLKMFFRELKHPLIPFELYGEFIEASKIPSMALRVQRFRDLVFSLPPTHFRTLATLIVHLNKVAGYCEYTKMESSSLAIVFAPGLLRSQMEGYDAVMNLTYQNTALETMINQCEFIFAPPQ